VTQDALEPLTVLGLLLAAQGLVGSVQYELKLPTDMVWVHVTLATFTWLAVLWSVAAAGRLVPRVAPVAVTEGARSRTGWSPPAEQHEGLARTR
jgi:heme A synthase